MVTRALAREPCALKVWKNDDKLTMLMMTTTTASIIVKRRIVFLQCQRYFEYYTASYFLVLSHYFIYLFIHYFYFLSDEGVWSISWQIPSCIWKRVQSFIRGSNRHHCCVSMDWIQQHVTSEVRFSPRVKLRLTHVHVLYLFCVWHRLFPLCSKMTVISTLLEKVSFVVDSTELRFKRLLCIMSTS